MHLIVEKYGITSTAHLLIVIMRVAVDHLSLIVLIFLQHCECGKLWLVPVL